LYDQLIAPVAEDLRQAKTKTLMLSPDGALLYDGERYLAETYAVAVFTEAAADRIVNPPKKSWEVAGLGVTQAHENFSALDWTQVELEGIVKRKNGTGGVLDGVIQLDQAFTEASLRQVSNQYSVLHMATHFRFSPGTEKDSFLLLGDGQHLDLEQLRLGGWDFSGVDLLTLSACETAVGGGQGQEVEGMAVTVQNRGAKGVIATLWPVADNTTALLMRQMYALRQGNGLSKAEALRRAQVDLMQGRLEAPKSGQKRGKIVGEDGGKPDFRPDSEQPFAHPYYWAPFILMGNWL
jgi:CHAT domain-containing protein